MLVFSCKRCDIEIKKPDDIKSIDLEDYNDVYTVFWNYLRICPGLVNPPEITIKIYGKIDDSFKFGLGYFELIDEREHEYYNIYDFLHEHGYPVVPSVRVFYRLIKDELREKLDSSDLNRKCYIKVILSDGIAANENEHSSDGCCFVVPDATLSSIDDIYFEE